ncbi:hypothetical protein M404DRAFT_1005642, partial [Pisolithus tinctorius Marx 270]
MSAINWALGSRYLICLSHIEVDPADGVGAIHPSLKGEGGTDGNLVIRMHLIQSVRYSV